MCIKTIVTFNLIIIFGILLCFTCGQIDTTYSTILTVNHSLIYEMPFHKLFRNIINFIHAPVHRIIPGTLWCGDGNMSDQNGILGRFFRVDSCCREHDLCDMNIPADETRYGLTNDGSFTKSACHCDKKFYECLKTVNSPKSREIGRIYFNKISPTCFVFDYPMISCNKTSRSWFRTKCIAYNKDTNANPIWQWNDNLIF